MITTRKLGNIVWDNYHDNKACSSVTDLYPHNTFSLPPSVEVGEIFTRLSPVTGSDHVAATPWSFSKISLENPSWDATQSVSEYNNYCKTRRFTYLITVDGVSWTQIRRRELSLPVYSQKERDFVVSMSVVKAQASVRRALASLPMLYSERKASMKTIGLYSKAILNNVITLQRKDLKRWVAAVKRHKSRPEKLKRIAGDISNRHLEFVFGVLPLIDDILGLAEFVGKPNLSVRTGRGNHTSRSVSESSKMGPSSLLQPKWETTTERVSEFSVRTGLRYDVDSSILNDASRLGFNPIYSWYDATPLSFVVGWFSNLNHWLQSLDATPGLIYRTGYSTIRTTTKISRVTKCIAHADPSVILGGEGASKGENLLQNRIVYSSEPGLQSLHFVDNASFFAAAASVSLAVQRLVKTANRELAQKPFRYRGPKPRYLPPIKYKRV